MTQGYCLAGDEARGLRLGLRFSTALCFVLVVVAVVLGSWPLLLGLSAVGFVAGFTPRHPFDLLWNHGVRHVIGAPELQRSVMPSMIAKPALSWVCQQRGSHNCRKTDCGTNRRAPPKDP